MKLAPIKSVSIPVLVLVESMQTVKSETTILFVRAYVDTPEILSQDVKSKSFSTLFHLILASLLLVVRMLCVALLAIKPHAHVFLQWLEILHIVNQNVSVTLNAQVI
jgi:hypothetical protein